MFLLTFRVIQFTAVLHYGSLVPCLVPMVSLYSLGTDCIEIISSNNLCTVAAVSVANGHCLSAVHRGQFQTWRDMLISVDEITKQYSVCTLTHAACYWPCDQSFRRNSSVQSDALFLHYVPPTSLPLILKTLLRNTSLCLVYNLLSGSVSFRIFF
jgi:hypothetical protein